ncbi:MAG: hypothetical protein AAF389_17035 [Gemmatimonadota bacterium]
MIHRRTTLLLLLAVILMGAGCAAQTSSEFVVSSDPELASLASEILPDVAARSGMELSRPVRLEVRDSEELERYLVSKLDADLPPDEARARVDVYSRLGLVEPDLDLRALLLSLYGEQVAGFYEPDSTAFFIIEGQQEMALRPLLAHELVHAVQDQSTDLVAITDPDIGSDRASAAMAVVEGQATLVMLEYMTEQVTGQPADLAAIEDFAAQVRPTLELAAQFPALANAPRVIRDGLIFPYVEGAIYVHTRWNGTERTSLFGDDLPLSTEQILDPLAGPPIDVSVTAAAGEVVLTDQIGRLELGILAEDVLGAGDAPFLDAWAGDRYLLTEAGDGSRTLTYAVAWDDESSADSFEASVLEREVAFGGPVRVRRVAEAGLPTTILQVGAPVDVTVEVGPS